VDSVHGKVRCLGCGKIDLQEMAYLESLVPPPRILAENFLAPVSSDIEPTPKGSLVDIANEVVTLTLGECSDCGTNSWTQIDGRMVTLSEPTGQHIKKANG